MPIGLASMTGLARWFVDAQDGDDSNTGLAHDDPLKTLGALLGVWDDGDPAACQGWFREQITLDGAGNHLIGVAEPGTLLPSTITRTTLPTWTNTTANIWEATLAGGVTAHGVALNWRTNIDDSAGTATGVPFHPKSQLRPGTFGSLAEGQWAQSGTTVQIHAITGFDPDEHDYDVGLGGHALMVSGEDILVRGWRAGMCLDPGATSTNAIALIMSGALRSTLMDCVGADATGHVISSEGGDRGGNRIIRCTAMGQTSLTLIALFSSVQGDYCDTEDLHVIVTRVKDWQGNSLSTSGNVSGVVVHGGAGIADQVHRRMTIDNPLDECSTTLAFNGPFAAAVDPTITNHAALPIRMYDCIFRNSRSVNFGDNNVRGGAAMVRCYADGLAQGAIGGDSTLFGVNRFYLMFDRCALGCMLGAGGTGTNNYVGISIQNDSTVRLVKTLLPDWSMESVGTNAALLRPLGDTNQDKAIIAHGCVFVGARKLLHGTNFSASQLDFRDNIYAGFNETDGYRNGTQAAWISGVDDSAGSIYMPVVSAERTREILGLIGPTIDRDAGVRPGEGLLATQTFDGFDVPAGVGINDRKDSGHYGPVQWGTPAAEDPDLPLPGDIAAAVWSYGNRTLTPQ